MATTIGSFDLASLKNLRDDVTQYFWFESNSSSAWGSGAHVTLYPESQFTDSTNPNYMKGQNIIMNTDGFSIRNGALPMMVLDNNSLDFNAVDTSAGTYVTTALFSSTGARIGQIGESHLEIDYHSLQMIDKEGDTYFYVSDLRTKQEVGGQVVYLADVIEPFMGNGSNTRFNVTFPAIQSVTSVTINGVATSAYTYDSDLIAFTTAPASGSAISVEYVTNSNKVKAYTFGIRNSSAFVGALSVVEGYNSDARGMYSHAEGSSTSSQGTASHTEGRGTIARKDSSHAEGNWTETRSRASHAEGINTITAGEGAHAEGWGTRGYGDASHAEGKDTTSAANYSHAQNLGTLAQYQSQTVIGEYNDPIYGDAFEIGNGNGIDGDPKERSNALTVDWSGNVEASGDVTDGTGNLLPFIAKKDITTYDEITTALDAGKMVFAVDVNQSGTIAYTYSTKASGNYIFTRVRNYSTSSAVGVAYLCVNSSNVWTTTNSAVVRYNGGTASFSDIATNSYKDATISFGETFGSTPHVIACLSTTGTAGNIGNVSVSVHTITTTGCKIRVFNNRGSSLSPNVEWIAIGT